MSKDIKNLIKKEYSYPSPKEEDFQNKIYKKREFYYHKIPKRDILKNQGLLDLQIITRYRVLIATI